MHPSLRHLVPIVEDLGPHGVSGDESDHHSSKRRGERCYTIIQDEWRAPEVTKWVRTLDHVYMSFKFNAAGKSAPGNWVRTRNVSRRISSKTDPVAGLPRNFYDKKWLKSLNPFQRERLDIKDFDFDFTLSEDILT